jgi:hypothetical protein
MSIRFSQIDHLEIIENIKEGYRDYRAYSINGKVLITGGTNSSALNYIHNHL